MRSYKGKYKPMHPEKYAGDPENIIYRSLLERRFMVYCDQNSSILKWCSEEIVIKYLSPIDNKIHRYFPDFLIEVKDKQDNKKVILIEVKPHKECSPPKVPKTIQTRRFINECTTYAVNQAKWNAAKELCKINGWEWQVLTEKELKP